MGNRIKTLFNVVFFFFCFLSISPLLFAIEISEIKTFDFPSVASDSTSFDMTVAPEDGGAAVFDSTGNANQDITVTIQGKKNFMYQVGGHSKITIKDFTFGGSLIDVGSAGSGTFDQTGELHNMRMGCTVKIPNKPNAGTYTGNLTLRVVYQ